MRALLGGAMTFIVLAVAFIIGGTMIEKSYNVSQNISGSTTVITALYTSVGNALTTFAALLPILALALVGGLALAYLMGFFGGRGGEVAQ